MAERKECRRTSPRRNLRGLLLYHEEQLPSTWRWLLLNDFRGIFDGYCAAGYISTLRITNALGIRMTCTLCSDNLSDSAGDGDSTTLRKECSCTNACGPISACGFHIAAADQDIAAEGESARPRSASNTSTIISTCGFNDTATNSNIATTIIIRASI